MGKLALLCVVAVGSLLLAACGGGSTRTTVTNCSPSGTKLSVTAKNIVFDTTCLAAPAGRPFTIAFHNEDGSTTHNMAIYTDSSADKALFQGKLVVGVATETYDVKALPAGRYFFRCDVHPQMNGTFNVK
ncbi:MAG: cupredoxin domain-containing protein [Actinomycetota bacterium]|nr:cupredoxin domain-containing protein [Actinomycetota bacterium]